MYNGHSFIKSWRKDRGERRNDFLFPKDIGLTYKSKVSPAGCRNQCFGAVVHLGIDHQLSWCNWSKNPSIFIGEMRIGTLVGLEMTFFEWSNPNFVVKVLLE